MSVRLTAVVELEDCGGKMNSVGGEGKCGKGGKAWEGATAVDECEVDGGGGAGGLRREGGEETKCGRGGKVWEGATRPSMSVRLTAVVSWWTAGETGKIRQGRLSVEGEVKCGRGGKVWEGEQVCVEVGVCGGVGAQILASSLGSCTAQHTQACTVGLFMRRISSPDQQSHTRTKSLHSTVKLTLDLSSANSPPGCRWRQRHPAQRPPEYSKCIKVVAGL